MFILGLEGENLDNNPNLITALKSGLGGVIFFTQNIKTPEQFKKLIEDIKSNSEVTPFLSIDQEGGRVERTENIHGGKKYLSARFAAAKSEKFLKEQTEQIALELKDYGINLNFAPCLDVNTNPDNPIIGERAFSDNEEAVSKFGKIVVETYLENGIMPCTKHFPGHGDASVDSHLALPKIDLPLEEMEKNHIAPFKKVPSPMIMVAHLHCTCFNKEEIPSSLSKNVIDYLRKNIGFDGLIITDDMVMGALSEKIKVKSEMNFSTLQPFNPSTSSHLSLLTSHCIKAIKAGVNILLYRDSKDETIRIIENLAKLAETDSILRENIESSYDRISMIKCKWMNCE